MNPLFLAQHASFIVSNCDVWICSLKALLRSGWSRIKLRFPPQHPAVRLTDVTTKQPGAAVRSCAEEKENVLKGRDLSVNARTLARGGG